MNDTVLVSDEMLSALRDKITRRKDGGLMSEKRYGHTLEVEKMAVRLAELYVPEKSNTLRAAALLHDITKEYSAELQIKLCAEYGIDVSETEAYAPKTFHAKTAAALLDAEFPEFASDEIKECVRWHTTGRADMTLCEKLVYLADYIDMSRSFEDCVRLRNYFFDARPEAMTEEERLRHLDDTLLLSYYMTIRGLLEGGSPISEDTIAARNELAVKRLKRKTL